jgi:hypothetical protein
MRALTLHVCWRLLKEENSTQKRIRMTKERIFRKDYAKELLAIAAEDLVGAKVLFSAKLKRQEI